MTNNEQAAAHRILRKHGIEHKLQGHRLPLTSDEFAIGIDGGWYQGFVDVVEHVQRVANKYSYAEYDMAAWIVAEITEAAKRDANADKP